MALQSIEKYLGNFSKSICEGCGEEFNEEYNFCPLCSNELKKEGFFKRVKNDNSIIAEWNDEEVCIFDKEIFLSSPHFSESTVKDCFEWKDYLDHKLVSDFIGIDTKAPQKLSFKETFSIFILKQHGQIVKYIVKFVPEYNEEDFDDNFYQQNNIEVLKIREDLYVIVVIDYVEY